MGSWAVCIGCPLQTSLPGPQLVQFCSCSGWHGASNVVSPSVESLEEEVKGLKALFKSENKATFDALTPVMAEIEGRWPGALPLTASDAAPLCYEPN